MPATSKRQGRPRSRASHDAILDAATRLIKSHSYTELSIEAIAQAACVSKATIYRWWPNKLALVLEVLSYTAQNLPEPAFDGEDFHQHLFKCLKGGSRFLFNSAITPLLLGALADCNNDPQQLSRLDAAFFSKLQTIGLRDLASAVANGQLTANVNPEILLDQLWGPLYYRVLLSNKPVDDDYLLGLLDNLACLRQLR